eukprot:COSAG05_NODE_4846_length_1351_cov_1.164537_2_plen_70_part_00
MYVAALVPFRFGFDIELENFSIEWWVELVVDLYFIVDFMMNFRTGYLDERLTMVSEHSTQCAAFPSLAF